MRFVTVIAILFFSVGVSIAQEYILLRGYVTDSNAIPMPGVLVRLIDGSGTITDDAGRYELRLVEGVHRVSFQYIGHTSQTMDQLVKGPTTLNITMYPDESEIGTITVTRKRKDLSYQIIRNAIEAKEKYLNQYVNQKRKIYVKSKEKVTTTAKMDDDDEPEEEVDIDDIGKQPKDDSIPNLNYFEGSFTQYTRPPRGFKQVKEAAKKLGSQRTLMYTNTSDADFNFLNNLIYVKRLGDNSYVSPLSNTAMLSYKYKLLGSSFDGDQKYYRIQVKPRKMGNALFSGELHIWDSTWALKYIDLDVPKRSLILYTSFNIKQWYGSVQEKRVLEKELLTWDIKTRKDITDGTSSVLFQSYSFDSTYAKRFFNAEIGITQDSAYERDTSFWSTIRPEPLTNEEALFIAYSDSVMRVRTSKWYLDSIDSVFNKLTFLNVTWQGQGHINRAKKTLWSFDPLISMINPVAIGGFRLRYGISYTKTFENRKRIFIAPYGNYGFRNNDMKGGLSVRHLYNPKKLSNINVSFANDFGAVNNFATIRDVFSRSNFYEVFTSGIFHSTELFNGFYLRSSLRANIRKPLTEFAFNPQFDSTFNNTGNPPLDFDVNGSSIIRIGISYTPKQLFIQEPKEKIVLGSRYPTFSLYYEKAVPRLFGATTDFQYAELGMAQKINLGIFGRSEYSVQVGAFLDTSEMLPMDYKWQRGGDPYFFLPPMFGYQLIDSTFPVFKSFFESHYNHEFNGFITSKIPGLKQLNIKLSGGGGLLYVPERNFQYIELHAGASRVFRLGKERIKIGIHYAAAQSNQQGFRNGFKFLITPFNAENSSWAF